MRLQQVQNRINELMARLVAQVKGANAISRTDINHVAEVVLVPLLAEAYGYFNLRSLNIEEGENFPSVDLGDAKARVAIQVTSTPTLKKIRKTLEAFGRHETLGAKYDRLIVYVLTSKQRSYSAEALKASIPPGLSFDPRADIWDSIDLLKRIAALDLDAAERLLSHLEEHIGDGQSIFVEKDVVEPLRQYLEEQIALVTRLPAYYPKKVTFDRIRQRVRVSSERLLWSEEEAKNLEEARRRGHFPAEGNGGRAYLRRGAEQFGERGVGARTEVKAWEEAWGDERKAIVLGDPGFGKTWLLKAEACRLARRALAVLDESDASLDGVVLPIYARLADINRTDSPLVHEVAGHVRGTRSKAFGSWVEGKILAGQCVMLLDAWDEVRLEPGELPRFEAGFRQRLGQRLDEFARSNPRTRLVMTSRIVGYGSSPVYGANEMELVAFDQPEIEAFADVWFGAVEGERFLMMLQASYQVKELARIPLMLSMMCRAYDAKGRAFPKRRVELYDRCLKGLLRDWREEKAETSITAEDEARLEAELELLEEIALGLLGLGEEQFTAKRLRQLALSWLSEVPPEHELHGRKASELIGRLERNGIFVRAGAEPDAPLLFLHRTFHEYLAAGALARRELDAIDIGERTLEADWDEVIVLLAGRLEDPDDLDDLLAHLADAKIDGVLRHRLGLAASCLAEISEEHRSAALVESVTGDVIATWRAHSYASTTAAVPHLKRALQNLAVINGQVEGERLLDGLAYRINHRQREEGWFCCQLIREMGAAAATPKIIEAVLWLLMASTSRSNIPGLEALAGLGSVAAWPEVVDSALGLLTDHNPSVREAATDALVGLGRAAITLGVDELLGLLRDEDKDVRTSAAQVFRGWGSTVATPEILEAILALLRDADGGVRASAAEALGGLGSTAATPEILEAMLALLRDEDQDVRTSAAEALGMLGNAAATPEILEAMLALLRDADQDVRTSAAEALGGLGSAAATPEILEAVLALLRETHWYAPISAVIALRKLGSAAATPEVLDAVLALLRDGDRRVRALAAKALGGLGSAAAMPEAIDTVLALLRDTDQSVRVSAAEALEEIGSVAATPEVLDAVLALLRDRDRRVRASAEEAFRGLGSAAATPKILEAMVTLLRDADESVRASAAEAIEGLGNSAATPEIVKALLALMRDEDQFVRTSAAETLGRMGSATRRFSLLSFPALWNEEDRDELFESLLDD